MMIYQLILVHTLCICVLVVNSVLSLPAPAGVNSAVTATTTPVNTVVSSTPASTTGITSLSTPASTIGTTSSSTPASTIGTTSSSTPSSATTGVSLSSIPVSTIGTTSSSTPSSATGVSLSSIPASTLLNAATNTPNLAASTTTLTIPNGDLLLGVTTSVPRISSAIPAITSVASQAGSLAAAVENAKIKMASDLATGAITGVTGLGNGAFNGGTSLTTGLSTLPTETTALLSESSSLGQGQILPTFGRVRSPAADLTASVGNNLREILRLADRGSGLVSNGIRLAANGGGGVVDNGLRAVGVQTPLVTPTANALWGMGESGRNLGFSLLRQGLNGGLFILDPSAVSQPSTGQVGASISSSANRLSGQTASTLPISRLNLFAN